jgi:hypothetical protein
MIIQSPLDKRALPAQDITIFGTFGTGEDFEEFSETPRKGTLAQSQPHLYPA